jgi:hypothetical protein
MTAGFGERRLRESAELVDRRMRSPKAARIFFVSPTKTAGSPCRRRSGKVKAGMIPLRRLLLADAFAYTPGRFVQVDTTKRQSILDH